MKRKQTAKSKATGKLVLAFLIVLNAMALLLTFYIHQQIETMQLDAGIKSNRTHYSHEPQIYNRSSGSSSSSDGNDVPYISEEQFHNAYSMYQGSLPNSPRTSRMADPSCGSGPDYFDFFRLPKSHRSRLFEDKIIYDTFFKPTSATVRYSNQDVPMTYVELGAFDGREESNTAFFDLCLGWDGLLIEAQSESYEKVIVNRPNAVKLSFSPTCTETISEGKQQTASFYNYPLSNNGMKDLAQSYAGKDTVEIPCGPLTPVLLDVFGSNKPIYFFSLDVEGAETLVLNTIDFAKLDIHVMMIEIQNSYCPNPMSCAQTHNIRQQMAEANYSLFADLVEASDVYVKQGTLAWKRGSKVQEENAKRQWILKRKMLHKLNKGQVFNGH